MDKKPKIALMSYAMDNRQAKGTALSTRRLIEKLVRDPDLDITLIHYDKTDDPLYREVREIVAPYIKLPFATRFVRTLLLFWKYRRERFDIIHWFQPRLYPFFWLAPAQHIVVTAHGAGDITAPGEFPLSRRMFNFVMIHFSRYLSAVIAVSDFGKEEIVEHYKIPEEKVHALFHYNGGAEEFRPLQKSSAQERVSKAYGINAPYILDVSRHDPHKNINRLITAYQLLRVKYPERKEKLVIVGSPSYQHEETYALAGHSPYKDDIQFVSFVAQEDMNALYSAAELFVFPSLNEGFGMPLIEAFASGTPVVTSDVTALPEVAGDAALLVDPTNPEKIAEAMQRVLSDQGLQAALVGRGLERAKTFTWKQSAEDLKALYFGVLKI